MRVAAVLLATFAFLSACSSVHVDRQPRTDLRKFRHFFVEHRLADNAQVDQAIVAELRARGFTASAGPRTMMPADVDALVVYHDDWAWDFKTYLIQLQIEIRSPHRNQSFATGIYRQPSPRPKPLPDVVALLFAELLKQP